MAEGRGAKNPGREGVQHKTNTCKSKSCIFVRMGEKEKVVVVNVDARTGPRCFCMGLALVGLLFSALGETPAQNSSRPPLLAQGWASNSSPWQPA